MNVSQYLHDLERYSVRFDGSVEVRITQGLSVELGAQFAFIHNQVDLPKGDADLEEVLLRRRQLETNYEAGLNFGFRYRFGSIYNNVVNTRFGGGGGRTGSEDAICRVGRHELPPASGRLSPAGTGTDRRFSGGGSAQTECAVRTQGGLYARLKSITVEPSSSGYGTRR
jgi:hypothetical protein